MYSAAFKKTLFFKKIYEKSIQSLFMVSGLMPIPRNP